MPIRKDKVNTGSSTKTLQGGKGQTGMNKRHDQ